MTNEPAFGQEWGNAGIARPEKFCRRYYLAYRVLCRQSLCFMQNFMHMNAAAAGMLRQYEHKAAGEENRMDFRISSYGEPDADIILFQMVDDHDLEGIDREIACIRELSGGKPFCLRTFHVNSWNTDLSPWEAPAVFGNEAFGDGASRTLDFLLNELSSCPVKGRVFLGGYSLAGLFALWAGYQTDCFRGIAAASPSVWFPGFTDYMKDNKLHADAVYLSLGDREEKTRNPVMARVGDAIREAYDHLRQTGTDCVLEWNKGNHFKDADLRTAKAFAWLMNREEAE